MDPEQTYKRVSTGSAVNMRQVTDGRVTFTACTYCSRFAFPRCSVTGETIPYPATGPVGADCPLEVVAQEGDDG